MKVLRPPEPRVGDKRVIKDGRLMEYGPVLGGLDWIETGVIPVELDKICQHDEKHCVEMGEMVLQPHSFGATQRACHLGRACMGCTSGASRCLSP